MENIIFSGDKTILHKAILFSVINFLENELFISKKLFLPPNKDKINELEPIYHAKLFEKNSVRLVLFLMVRFEKVMIYY